MNPHNSQFYKFLVSGTKADINHIRKLFQCDDIPSSLKKEEMAAEVADYILNESEYWMRMLPSTDIQYIDELLQHKPGYKLSVGYLPYVPIIEEYGIVSAEYDEDDNCYFSVDVDMYNAFKYGIKNAIAFMAAKDMLSYEVITRGILNLYGVVPCNVLFDILKSAEPEITAETGYYSFQPSYLIFISESLLLRNHYLDYNRTPYYCNPSIEDPLYFIKEQNSRREINFKKYTIADFKEAGKNPPFCSVGVKLRQSKLMLKEFQKYAGNDIDEVIDYDNLYSLAQIGIPGIIDMVTEDLKFPSIGAANEFIGYVNEFSNHIPHWTLKGWSPDEIFNQFERQMLKPLPKLTSFSRLHAFECKLKADALEKELGVRRVGRNDPCPCGSGKKFKDCHGKCQS